MILENVKLNWARLGDNPGTKYMSEVKEWSVDVVLNDAQAMKWMESGIKPAVKVKDGVKTVKLRKDCVWKTSGDAKKAPMVVNEFGDNMDPAIIGNDSVGNVQFSVREWEFQGTKGKSAELVAVQVTTLNEFTGSSSEDPLAFSFSDKVEAPLQEEEQTPF